MRFADLVNCGAAVIDASVLTWLGAYYSDSEIVDLVIRLAALRTSAAADNPMAGDATTEEESIGQDLRIM